MILRLKSGQSSLVKSKLMVAFATIFVLSLMVPSLANSQSTGGRIRGTISDPSGSAVAGAKVILINEATNITRDTETGANGEYLFIEVPVGSYELDVAQQGFKKYVRKG